jgi:hypothetical protein
MACPSQGAHREVPAEGQASPERPPLKVRGPGEPGPAPTEVPPLIVERNSDPSQDLATQVQNFEGLRQCVRAMGQHLPASVGELLQDIGYSSATTDACRSLQALAEKAPNHCDGLAISASQAGCQRRYAMYYGEPDLCPVELRHGGRHPLCLAVALRDPSMCHAALAPNEVGLCRAMILRSPRPCRVAHNTARDAQRCANEAARWWRVLPPPGTDRRLPWGFAPSATLCRQASVPLPLGAPLALDPIEEGDEQQSIPGDGGPQGHDDMTRGQPAESPQREPECRDNPHLLRRGVILRQGEPLVIGDRRGTAIGRNLPLFELSLESQLAGGTDSPAPLALGQDGVALWVSWNRAGLWHRPGRPCAAGDVRLDEFSPERGAIVSGQFEAQCGLDSLHVTNWRGGFRTFVRDVVTSDPADRGLTGHSGAN